MKYREFLSLSDEEIKFIVNEIFHPVKIDNIKRDKAWNAITCDITTDGWKDGETTFSVTDELELRMPSLNDNGLDVDFSILAKDCIQYKQYLLSKGCNEYLKDNPYL